MIAQLIFDDIEDIFLSGASLYSTILGSMFPSIKPKFVRNA
jgi:hypothetical protein